MATQVVMEPGWENHLNQAMHRMLARIGDDVADTARQLAPVDTGRLRASIHAEPVTGRTVRVVATAPYAAWVELGTGPHIIEPTRKQALHWPGARHPVTHVNHPGTEPSPFMKPALFRVLRGFTR